MNPMPPRGHGNGRDHAEIRARSFGSAAAAYERARATYPAEAVLWALGAATPAPRRVLDLGAGTGRLTCVLLELGFEVIAVEPDPPMRAFVPTLANVLAGVAERIPLANDTVDAVLVGQAWHWFDQPAAMSEIRRVLRPGGALGLLWNVYDDGLPWVALLADLLAAEDRYSANVAHATLPEGPQFQRGLFAHRQAMSRDLLVDHAASRSRVAVLPPGQRAALLGRVRAAAPSDEFEMPWVCDTWRARIPERPDRKEDT